MGYFYSPGSTYFVTYKCVDGCCFFDTNNKKRILLKIMLQLMEDYCLNIIAFAILSNHYHLVLRVDNFQMLRKGLQKLNGSSAFQINKLDKEHGRKIWDKNKLSWQVRNEADFLRYVVYVIGNPLKDRIVKSLKELEDYKYCNYKEVVKMFDKHILETRILEMIKDRS